MLDEIAKIKEKLESGENVRRYFWKAVGEVKRSQIDDPKVIDALSQIRETLFEKRLIISFRTGFLLFSTLFVLINILFLHVSLTMKEGIAKVIALLIIETGNIYTSFLAGRCIGFIASGIGAEGFYRYAHLEFGVKVNFRDYLTVEPKKRVILYSGAILLEHIILLAHAVFLFAIDSYWEIPAFLLAVNLPFSYLIHRIARTGELHRLIREIKILKSAGK